MRPQTWMSMDPALGGGNAFGILQPTGTHLHVIDCRIDYGLARTEQQLDIIEWGARKYRPSLLILEFDSQQKGLGNDDRLRKLAGELGFDIHPHLTRGNKIDAVFDVASMNQSFVRREITIPWSDDETRRRMEALVTQLRQWRPDVPAKRLRQDAVMMLWFAWRRWQQIRAAQHAPPVPQWRPSWFARQGKVA